MDKRHLVKVAAKFVVTSAVAGAVTKTLSTVIPATQKYKTAELAGVVVGAALVDPLEAQIDAFVDRCFDRKPKIQIVK